MKLLGRLLILIGVAMPLFIIVWDMRQEIGNLTRDAQSFSKADLDFAVGRDVHATQLGLTLAGVGVVLWLIGTVRQWKRRKKKPEPE